MNASKTPTVNQRWEDYTKAIWPAGQQIGEVQRRETKRAFYAGALVIFEVIAKLACNLPEEEATKMLEAMLKETEDTIEKELLKPHGN